MGFNFNNFDPRQHQAPRERYDFRGFDPRQYGDSGNAMGRKDIDHLKKQGASDYDIAEYIREFKGTVGNAARDFERSNTQAPKNENAMGKVDIDYLKGQGASDNEISEYIRNFSGTVGSAAQDYASQHTQAPTATAPQPTRAPAAKAPQPTRAPAAKAPQPTSNSSTAQADSNSIYNYWANINNSTSNSNTKSDANQEIIKNFKPNQVGGEGIGQKDIDALLGKGLTQNEVSNYIKSYSADGGIVGEKAAKYAGVAANYGNSATSNVLNDFNPDNVGGEGIGQQDIDTLVSQGFTPNAIKQYVTNYSNKGGVVGPAAAKYAGVNPSYGKQSSTWSTAGNKNSGQATGQTSGNKNSGQATGQTSGNKNSGQATGKTSVDKGLFNFQGIMDQFYNYQPGENDAAGNAMKNTFAANMIQSGFDSTLATQMAEKQTQLAQSTMTQGADLELRNTDSLMQKQYEQGLGSMGMQYDLQNKFAGNQHGRDVAMLEATGVDHRATIGETGQQNRLQRITEGEQDRLTDSNRILATGTETRAIDSNKIKTTGQEQRATDTNQLRTSGQEQRAGMRVSGEETRATDTNQLRTSGEESRAGIRTTGEESRAGIRTTGEESRAGIRTTGEETRATIGTQSAAAQALERVRGLETRATDTNQLRTSGQEQRAGIRTTGEESRAGIRTTGAETRATDTNQLRTSGEEQRATIGTQSDAAQALERTRAFEQRATDTNQLRTSGQEQRAGVRTTGEETRATDSNRLRTTGEETRATDSNRLATEGSEQRRTIGTQGDQNVRLVTAQGDDTRNTLSHQSRLDAKRYVDQGRSSRRLARSF